MSVNDYTVKKVDFVDLSQKAKDAYWKAFKELYSVEGSTDVGNAKEGNESKIISTHGRPRADDLGQIFKLEGSSSLPHSKRGKS